MILIEPIQNIISTCLNNFQYQDAIFISERLHSELQTEESLYLLSLSHYRAHKTLKAYHLLKSRYLTLAKCKYLLSKCCIDLNKFGEAETILTECTFTKQKLYDEIIKEYGEYSCFVLQILAFVYSKTDRTSQAIEFHKKCLRLNPFLWSSFESLCVLGEKLDPYKYFTTNSAIQFYSTHILPNQTYENGQINNNFTIDLNSNNNNNNPNTSTDQLFAFTNTNKPQNYAQNVQNLSLSDLFVVKENSFNNIDELNYSKSSTKTELNETTNTSQSQAQLQQQQQAPQQQHQQHDTSIGMISESHKTSTKLLNVTGDSNSNDVLNSLQTPPPQAPLITTMNAVAPAKKVTKRLPVKPLSGKNTGNLANIALSNNTHQTSFSNMQTVRRSSRIFAQSANAVKENKKMPTTNSSSSTTTGSSGGGGVNATSSSSGTTTNTGLNNNSKLNKRLKIKKKLNTTTSLSNSSSTSSSISTESPTKHDSQANISANTTTTTTASTNQNQDKLGSINYPAMKFYQKSNIIDETERLSLENMMKILRDIGFGVVNLHQYECKRALEYFEDIPLAHYQSSYVLGCIGKALFELHNYQKAEQIYLQLRQLHPYHLEGLEYYSTVLWHLQKEIALSSLAQELIEYDKLAPETWCVVGNCFSLHKEHDAAIKFFQRATQINSNFVYAYNLLGHEYFLIEEMEKGLSCFRKAIFLDSRHYNAWYGISMINLKQEKFLLAENYLKKALMINPHSSTLMCHIAVVYHSMKKSEKALEILERALEIEPKNFLCKFHRASILFSMGKYEMALRDFERLRRQIPKESLIYYMISKTHKKLRNIHLSLTYMSWAMDLDPKGVNNQLKESIDKRYVVDNDSTFARELETINTSTLDAIYGVDSSANNGDDNSELADVDTSEAGAGVGSLEGARVNNDLTVDADIVEQDEDDDKDESSLLSASLYVNKISNLLSTHHISSTKSLKSNDISIATSIATTSSAGTIGGGGGGASMDAIGASGDQSCSITIDNSKKISMSSSTSLVEEHSLFNTRDLLDNNNTIEHENNNSINTTTNSTTNNNNTNQDEPLVLNNSQSTQDQAMDLNEDD